MQLVSQQLTVVNEHNKAPQILYQLHLLLFYCLISLVSLSLKKILFLLPYQFVVFLRNKYYLSQQF